MAGHGEKKSRDTEKAIIALLTEPTLKQAAKTIGINESTLWRWMQEDEFKKQYSSAKKMAVSQAISRMQQICGRAVEVLQEVMDDPVAPAPSRVTAAKTIIEMTLRAVEIEDLEERITQLEQAQNESYRRGAV
jgi:hypothetical protein